jgi:hypothetical protein
MNEIQVILLGIILLAGSVAFFFFTDLVPKQIASTEMNVIVSLGFIVDKRQSHYLDEIIQTPYTSLMDLSTAGRAHPCAIFVYSVPNFNRLETAQFKFQNDFWKLKKHW